jgi:AcrR family transcriptional regulator
MRPVTAPQEPSEPTTSLDEPTGSAGPAAPPRARVRRERVRMTGKERREQLIDVGRTLFADKGFDAVTIEEIAAKAGVSKPVVYEHFGDKTGLYEVIVDREITRLVGMVNAALDEAVHPRALLEQAGMALFDYIEGHRDGFQVLVRPRGVHAPGGFASIIRDVADTLSVRLAPEFESRGFSKKLAPMYSQMLVGMVALTGQWWVDARKPKKDEVVAHVVNLAWNGLTHLEPKPELRTTRSP